MKTIDELYEKWNSISPFSDGYLLVSGDHPYNYNYYYSNYYRLHFGMGLMLQSYIVTM